MPLNQLYWLHANEKEAEAVHVQGLTSAGTRRMDRKIFNPSAAMALFQRRRRNTGMTTAGTPSDKGMLNAVALFRRGRGRRGIFAAWRAAMFGPANRRSMPPSECDES
jgi:hypothetical protein